MEGVINDYFYTYEINFYGPIGTFDSLILKIFFEYDWFGPKSARKTGHYFALFWSQLKLESNINILENPEGRSRARKLGSVPDLQIALKTM